ncbi:MAG TPA: DNA polymerase III subunit gamma/tau [Pyrinomonadaceae bacterium]|nr:DNA polymerase III subunit gamma/tau [Pyrinomonadaceae bacterium]
MSYQVIARKWRPQAFEEVTGQEHITRTLRNAIESERLHHAYLFSGARGVGKTTTARLLAKAVNCHKSDRPTPTPCSTKDPDQCPSCQEIAEGRSIDVLEIDAASNTGVENVRDAIINTVGIRPARDRYKVFIIDEVHMLSGPAFNALLKTLEEPPPRVLFIMATTHAHKVPETILSRCQQFEFRTISAAKIFERLKLIASAEGIEVADDALREVARAGEGSMRDAQSAFDQVISFSEGRIEASDVETALGIAGAELRGRVMRAVANRDPADVLAVVADLVARGHDLRNFCRDLMSHVRDLLVAKAAGDAALADVVEAERRELVETAAHFSESDLVRFFHSLTETERNLRESAHPRYQLEIGLVKLVEMRRLAPLAQLLERLDALEEALRTGRAPVASGGSAPPPQSPTPARRGNAGGGSVGGGGRTAAGHIQTDSRQAQPTTHAQATTHAQTATPARTPTGGAPPPSAHAPAQAPALKLVSAQANANTDALPSSFAPSDDAPPFPVDDYDASWNAGRDTAGFSLSGGEAAPRVAPDAHAGAQQNGGRGDYAGAGVPTSTSSWASHAGSAASSADDPVARIKRALDERRKPFLAVAVESARRVRVEDETLHVEFAPDAKHLRDLLLKPDNTRILREACRAALGHETQVSVTLIEPGAMAAASSASDGGNVAPLSKDEEERLEKQRLREWAEQQPQVQEVLRMFRGEIVDVRRADAGPKS